MRDKLRKLLRRVPDVNVIWTGSSYVAEEMNFTPSDIDLFIPTYSGWKLTIGVLTCEGAKLLTREDELKWQWSQQDRVDPSGSEKYIHTVRLTTDEIETPINISYKKGANSLLHVLASFDISCIMAGEDLSTGERRDIREFDVGEVHVTKHMAYPNPTQHQYAKWPVWIWQRQIEDRLFKYQARGFDVSHLLDEYIYYAEKALEVSKLFKQTDEKKEIAAEWEKIVPLIKQMKEMVNEEVR